MSVVLHSRSSSRSRFKVSLPLSRGRSHWYGDNSHGHCTFRPRLVVNVVTTNAIGHTQLLGNFVPYRLQTGCYCFLLGCFVPRPPILPFPILAIALYKVRTTESPLPPTANHQTYSKYSCAAEVPFVVVSLLSFLPSESTV